MDHDRWFGFGWGVGLGLLIGAGMVGGYCWPQIVETRAEAQQTHDGHSTQKKSPTAVRGNRRK
jgi:hypothetical protein